MTHDHNQRFVPESFIRLYTRQEQLTVSREELEPRHELAEDIALHAAERFKAVSDDDHGAQRDALRRTLAGLMTEPTSVTAAEAGWVVSRIRELCGWSI